MKSNLSEIQTKFLPILWGILLFCIAFFSIKGMMFGSTTNLKLLVGLVLVSVVVLMLDKNYWVLCPIMQVFPFSLSGLPFSSAELGCLVVIAVYFVRLAFRIDELTSIKKETILLLPYFVWICVIWSLNPTGLNMLGGETIGGRFYFKIVLAFFTFLVLSRFYVTEKQSKIIYFSLIILNVLNVFFRMFVLGAEELNESMTEDSNTKYYIESLGYVLILLLCRYRLRDILKFNWKFIISLLLFTLVAYSGRRTMMGRILMLPFVLMFLRGKDKIMTLVFALFACIILGFVLAGQGRAYELPNSMQRSLSFLPAKWDSQFDNYGTKDLFREELHRRAKEHIREHPWVGRKGYSLNRREAMWINASIKLIQGADFAGHEYMGNWHNKFWGMGADFGLPASFSWYFFSISAFYICWKRRKFTELGTYKNTLFLYYSLFMFFDLIFAYGHSALSPFNQWITFAIIIALLNNNGEYSSRKVLK